MMRAYKDGRYAGFAPFLRREKDASAREKGIKQLRKTLFLFVQKVKSFCRALSERNGRLAILFMRGNAGCLKGGYDFRLYGGDGMAGLDTDVRYIKGIGEQRAKSLGKLGISTLYDLVTFFPRGYEDRRKFKKLNELVPGETVCVKAMAAAQPVVSHIRKGMDIVKLRVVDGNMSMNITFFNQVYIKDNIRQGETYCFYGKVGGTLLRPEMVNPLFEPEASEGMITGHIAPLYHLTAGITQNMMTRAVRAGLTACGDMMPDPLPDWVQKKYMLAQSRYAYENIHFPKSYEELEIARRRLIFEELFVLASSMNIMKKGKESLKSEPIKGESIDIFLEKLPFSVTNAQRRAMDEVVRDLSGGEVMSRLVQGDVGSGKTVVSASGCWYVCSAGVSGSRHGTDRDTCRAAF